VDKSSIVGLFVFARALFINIIYYMPDKNKPNQNYKNYWLQLGLKMFIESTGWIALPVLGALFLGQWLDTRYNAGVLFFFSLTIFAFIISSIGIGITGVKYMKMIEKDEMNKKVENKKIKNKNNKKVNV